MGIARWAHRKLRNLASLLVAGGVAGALTAGAIWHSLFAASDGASAGILVALGALITMSR